MENNNASLNNQDSFKIYIAAFFDESDKELLDECYSELNEKNISLHVRNLSGGMMHSALDFADLEIIAFSYELIRSFMMSGAYDIIKCIIIKLWNLLTNKGVINRVPLTICINGIPTINGTENIKCKFTGLLSKKQKDKAIDKSYELAKQIEQHQFELLERIQFYNAFNAHVFRYDSTNESLTEMDIADEVRKKRSEVIHNNETKIQKSGLPN